MNQKLPVLVVDDEPDLRDVFSSIIEDMGYPCEAVGNGKEALKLIETKKFSCITMDINMPILDGLGALYKLRDMGSFVPILMVSAYGDSNNVIASLRLGAYDFIQKPFDEVKFQEQIKNAYDLGVSLWGLKDKIDHLAISKDEKTKLFELNRYLSHISKKSKKVA